ncbi:MAG TPA: hypothetical protein VGY55_02525 [Pirellulales bacterium]|jgi:hypothetical protein|nr:hypothetical protein [Pirellulales bacterium]
MDTPANQQLNQPQPDGSEAMPKVRPVFRVLGIVAFTVLAVASFVTAISIGFRQGFWSAAWSAYAGFVFAAIGVSWFATFRRERMKP